MNREFYKRAKDVLVITWIVILMITITKVPSSFCSDSKNIEGCVFMSFSAILAITFTLSICILAAIAFADKLQRREFVREVVLPLLDGTKEERTLGLLFVKPGLLNYRASPNDREIALTLLKEKGMSEEAALLTVGEPSFSVNIA